MRDMNTQKGFTLVELAIVMTIIGLLIGGILKGQELMQNARVTSTIAQVRAYEAATTTFRDKYDAIPGDMANASTRIPSCTASCNPAAGVPANAVPGDNRIGDPAWAAAAGWINQTSAVAVVGTNETELFWVHLLLSDLISGVTNAHLTGATPAAGATHPGAKIGGVFIVGNGGGYVTPGNDTTPLVSSGPSGMILALVQDPTATIPSTAGTGAMTPTRAAQIDRKMDDGRPNGGYVHATGLKASCFAGTEPTLTYLENVTTNDCGLVFRIQG